MLVAIGSQMRVGKDTAAQALIRDLSYVRVAFADPLKQLAIECDPLVLPVNAAVNLPVHNRLSWLVKGADGWDEAKARFPEVRRFLQNLGVGCRTVFGERFWIDMALAEAARNERTVFPDLRFRNEAEAVREAGGFLVKVNRPGMQSGFHVSEHDLDDWTDWDLVVENDSTIVELEAKVVAWAKGLERKKK